MKNIVDHLVSIYGSQAKVAKAAKCKQPSVSDWRKANQVPMERARILLKDARRKGYDLTAEHFFMTRSGRPVELSGASA